MAQDSQTMTHQIRKRSRRSAPSPSSTHHHLACCLLVLALLLQTEAEAWSASPRTHLARTRGTPRLGSRPPVPPAPHRTPSTLLLASNTQQGVARPNHRRIMSWVRWSWRGIKRRLPWPRNQETIQQGPFRVFCDLDGVLVDFCSGIRQLYQENEALKDQGNSFCVDDLHRTSMWQRVAQADSFFEHLPWMESGRSLWATIKHLQPTILTGVPLNPSSSRLQKVQWCRRELGVPVITHTDKAGRNHQHADVSSSFSLPSTSKRVSSTLLRASAGNEDELRRGRRRHSLSPGGNNKVCHVITCWSHNKHYESGPGAVLIDDRIELKPAWESKGGIFIHHKAGNLSDTLAQLQRHGVIHDFV